jgi:hypothetical protein
LATTTQEALEIWYDMIHDMSGKWTTLMEEAWLDLPPDTTKALIKASKAFAVVGENIIEHLGLDRDDDDDDDDDEEFDFS